MSSPQRTYLPERTGEQSTLESGRSRQTLDQNRRTLGLRGLITGVTLAAVAACTGQIGNPGAGGAGGSPGSGGGQGTCTDCPTTCTDCGPGSSGTGLGWTTRYPRLSHKQWENTTRDLLRLDRASGLSSAFTPDPNTHFDTNNETRSVAANLRKDYETAAEALAKQVAQNPTQLAKIMPANLTGDTRAKAVAFITAFGKRAFRRPLATTEVDALVALFLRGPELLGGDAIVSGVELTLRAILQSPFLLYRVESSTQATNDRVWLSGYEIANRLSYTLWNTMPSDALFAAAENGELSTPTGIEGWARTMLNDAKATDTLIAFHEQLFLTSGFGTVTKDPTRFPTFTLDLQATLQDEAHRFINDVVTTGGGFKDILTRPVTFVTSRTAPFYGLTGSFGSSMQRVNLDPQKRAGLLTQLGFLSKNGGLVQSDPIHRGVLINLNVLCVKLTAPNNIPPLPAQTADQTNRERVEAHTNTCGVGCHDVRINPIGFAFEHYDAIGQWRDVDNNKPINAAAQYYMDGQLVSFNGAIELSQRLAQSRQAHECYASNWLEYAIGRPPVYPAELSTVKAIADSSITGTSAKDLLAKITTLDVFRAGPVEVTQ